MASWGKSATTAKPDNEPGRTRLGTMGAGGLDARREVTTANLAKIERVHDLRATWPNEAQDFTPWLAENIAELGEALGMDLELQQTEAPVGGYNLDILATNLSSRRPVIIENQLETTDHSHLGQLLTYAAGFDAEAVVWVTREFRDEHRQALDWLNQRTGEDTEFFGVAVELWTIGDSLPATHFNVVASPNGWRKRDKNPAAGRGVGISSAKQEQYRNFFQSLVDTLREQFRFTNTRKGVPGSNCNFPTGHGSGICFSAAFIPQKRSKVELNFQSNDLDKNHQWFEELEEYKEEIESQLGQLNWDKVEGRKACRINLVRAGSIDDDDDTLAEIRDWMVENLLKFKEVFGPKLADLT